MTNCHINCLMQGSLTVDEAGARGGVSVTEADDTHSLTLVSVVPN